MERLELDLTDREREAVHELLGELHKLTQVLAPVLAPLTADLRRAENWAIVQRLARRTVLITEPDPPDLSGPASWNGDLGDEGYDWTDQYAAVLHCPGCKAPETHTAGCTELRDRTSRARLAGRQTLAAAAKLLRQLGNSEDEHTPAYVFAASLMDERVADLVPSGPVDDVLPVAVLEALASAWEDQCERAQAEGVQPFSVRATEATTMAACARQIRDAIAHGGLG